MVNAASSPTLEGMNAIDLLKAQHQEVMDLFANYEQTDDDKEKQDLFFQIADKLAAHATIEERVFYPSAYADKTQRLLTESVEEHLAMKRIIADLLDMTPSDNNFDAKVKVLKDEIEHHVDEEENQLFKSVRRTLGKERLELLGKQMKALFERELTKKPREAIPEQTHEAAPLI